MNSKSSVKLTEEEVVLMRQMHEEGANSVVLAMEFGVSRGTVGSVISRRTWYKV
jgi:hypothetical protein